MNTFIPEESHLSPVLDYRGACHYVCLGRTTVDKLVRQKKFARRIRLASNKFGFLRADLDAWLSSKKED